MLDLLPDLPATTGGPQTKGQGSGKCVFTTSYLQLYAQYMRFTFSEHVMFHSFADRPGLHYQHFNLIVNDFTSDGVIASGSVLSHVTEKLALRLPALVNCIVLKAFLSSPTMPNSTART